YAPIQREFLTVFLMRRGFDPHEMVEAGLLLMNEGKNQFYDRFTNRVLFPIEDGQGRVIAFGGRLLGNGNPKYLNSPESPIFHKSFQLYNLSRAKRNIRKYDNVVLYEGYFDALQS